MVQSRITCENGVFKVVGRIDEHLDYRPLLSALPPVKVDLSKVSNVNSVGMRGFLNFIRDAKDLALEFHNCSSSFIDMINTFPTTLGSPPNPAIVKSLIIEYQCVVCAKEISSLYKVDFVKGETPILPIQVCVRCSAAMTPKFDADDLFTYMVADD